MEEVKSILLVGVGGQGTILVSKVLTEGLVEAGYDVKMSEVHGMAQRGGSVSTQVRYGGKVHSPIVGRGGAEVLVAFEKLEALRYSPYLKPGGLLLVNDYEVPPMSVSAGTAVYPSGIMEELKGRFRTLVLDAASLARSLGNAKAMNVVLLGALVGCLGMEDGDWKKALRAQLPSQYFELNLSAFKAGLAAATGLRA